MRVLHFYKTYLPDSFHGGERVIYEIAESTAAHGVSTDVLSLSRHPNGAPFSIGHHLSHKAKFSLEIASTSMSVDAVRKFAALQRNADIVHYHFPWPFMDLAHFMTRVRVPAIVTYHSDVVRQSGLLQLYRPLMHAFLSRVSAIVATSPQYLESSPVLTRYRDKTSVIPIAITPDPEPDLTSDRAKAFVAQFGPRFFLFIGAFRYYKGLTYLVEAARQLQMPVVLAGDGELANYVRQNGAPNIHAIGAVSDSDKALLLALCSGFVFPSHLRSEAFGISLLEGAMAGKPLISCEIGTGTSYINVHGVTGYTVPPGDAAALAGAMQRLWDDPATAQRLGAAARQRAQTLFSVQQMGADYAALYQRLLDGSGRTLDA